MHFPKLLGIASGLALSSSMAFAWSIDGVVKSKVSGRLLAGVKINTFNFWISYRNSSFIFSTCLSDLDGVLVPPEGWTGAVVGVGVGVGVRS